MSLLTDTDIEKILQTELYGENDNSLIIYPFLDECLTPIGYDLRVGSIVATSDRRKEIELKNGESFSIAPNTTALITTLEYVKMPNSKSISGLIESKVTKVSRGLSHISTTVDPDWSGNLLIAVHNHSTQNFNLNFGDPFCTIIFVTNLSPSTRHSNKQPGRLDVIREKHSAEFDKIDEHAEKINKLLQDFSSDAAKEANWRTVKEYLPFLVILASVGIGYFEFNTTTGFPASVAAGAAIAQLLAAKLK